MNLQLLSLGGMRIQRLKQWMQKCHSCFKYVWLAVRRMARAMVHETDGRCIKRFGFQGHQRHGSSVLRSVRTPNIAPRQRTC